MANHPKLEDWQRAIQLLRARNATEQAPTDVKKDVGDKLKLLENVVAKFNTCFDDIDKRQGILEDVDAEAGSTLGNLKAQFDEAQGDLADTIKSVIHDVDTYIDAKEREPGEKRGDVQADLPEEIARETPSQLTTQRQAEEKRDDIKETLAVVESKLREVETFCAEVPKWESELAKARKAATDTSPIDNRIDSWTNISKLEDLKNKLGGLLAADAEQRTALKKNADIIAKLIGRKGILEDLLWNYRAVATRVETLKREVGDAEAAWKEAQASRRENILVKIEEATNTPPPPVDPALSQKQEPPPEAVPETTHQEGE